jgi:hypothetical protein
LAKRKQPPQRQNAPAAELLCKRVGSSVALAATPTPSWQLPPGRRNPFMDKPWFNPDTGMLLLDEYVADMPSFQKIMADSVITDDEIAAHAQRVVSLLQELDATLAPDAKRLATDMLCELAVLYALQRKRTVQEFCNDLSDYEKYYAAPEPFGTRGGTQRRRSISRTPTRLRRLSMGAFESFQSFPIVVPDLAPVAQDVMQHFALQGFEVKGEQSITRGWDISIHRGGNFKAVCGMKTALKI